MNYQSSEFLTDGPHSYEFSQLNYQDKISVLSLIALEKLSTSLEAIANVQTLSENVLQIQESNELLTSTNELMQQQLIDLAAEKDALQSQIDDQSSNATFLQGQVVSLSESNAALNHQLNTVTTRLNAFESLVRQIDTLTDEAVG